MSSRDPSGLPLPRRDPQRQADGARANGAVSAGEIDAAVVDCAIYDGGRRVEGEVELRSALERARSCDEGWVWIGLRNPSSDVVEAVGAHFGLHPLALEDAVHAHQRAKLETYGDNLFLVLKTARYIDHDELVEIGEVMVFMGERFVVSVRHGEGSPLHDVRKDLETHPDLLGMGPSAALYAIADRIVDDYAAVIEGIEVDIEEVEAEVFSGSGSNPAQRIYKLKREVLEFRRAARPLVAPLQRLTDHETGGPIDPRMRDYFRDVLDHLVRDADRIQGFDEILTGVFQANIAQLTVRDNEDLRKLSAWVAIIAVPTMVFGLYGMNFRFMPELQWRVGYPLVLVLIVGLCGALYWRFKRAKWL